MVTYFKISFFSIFAFSLYLKMCLSSGEIEDSKCVHNLIGNCKA
jgi:hypothetical protein